MGPPGRAKINFGNKWQPTVGRGHLIFRLAAALGPVVFPKTIETLNILIQNDTCLENTNFRNNKTVSYKMTNGKLYSGMKFVSFCDRLDPNIDQ